MHLQTIRHVNAFLLDADMKHKILSIFLILSLFQVKADYHFLVGTYTRGTQSEGIYYLQLSKKGKVKVLKLLAKSDNPSYLSFSPDKQFVYAVNEHGEDSEVSAFRFDKENKELKLINKVSAAGADPCYISVSERHVFIANYSSGSISVFERNNDGSLSQAVQVDEHRRMHYGNNLFGPSNAHQIIFSPDSSYLYATNLGSDKIITYRYQDFSKTNVLLEEGDETLLKKLSGPRHMEFSKNGEFLYVVHELDATVSVLKRTDENKLEIIQATSLVTDSSKENGAGDIHISKDGKYLFASNRGDNNDITQFKINKDGTLTYYKNYSSGGVGPRNFLITKDNKLLILANQHSNNIAQFKIKKRSKKLKLQNKEIELDAAVCLIEF